MNQNYLLPHRFKKAGWIILLPSVVLGVLYLFFDFQPSILDCKSFFIRGDDFFNVTNNNLIDEISAFFGIAGLLMIAFSREKTEDEFIFRLRLESLVWAVYVNYAVLLLGIVFVYGNQFFYVLIFNMFTVLVIFIIRFTWILQKMKRSLK